MDGKISVILPIYKVERELHRAVDSLLKQTYQNLEIILVDDGSPDGCPGICDTYQEQYEKIRVIHKENGGVSDARNVGLQAATGEFVMYLDPDDYLESTACEDLVRDMSPEVDFVVGSYRMLTGNRVEVFAKTGVEPHRIYTSRDFAMTCIPRGELYAVVWINLYRRTFLLENDLFYRKGIVHEDVEILPRMFFAASKIVYADSLFYNYVVREESIMTTRLLPEEAEHRRQMVIQIYSCWLEQIRSLQDPQLKRVWYGFLLKMYLYHAREKKIRGWKIPGLDYNLAKEYSLNKKEKLKALLFTMAPGLFFRL